MEGEVSNQELWMTFTIVFAIGGLVASHALAYFLGRQAEYNETKPLIEALESRDKK